MPRQGRQKIKREEKLGIVDPLWLKAAGGDLAFCRPYRFSFVLSIFRAFVIGFDCPF
jgi:hypothetical protein